MEYFGYYPHFSVMTGEVRYGLELTKKWLNSDHRFRDVRGAKLMRGGSGVN
jgi:hypothetical protein